MEASLRGSRLSLQQERLWTFYQESQGQGYVTQGMVAIEGPLLIERLHAAIQQLVERHEILRTVFRTLPGMDVPMQVVGEAEFVWYHTNLEQFSEQEQQCTVESIFTQNESLDLQNGPVLSVHVLTLQALRTLMIIRLPAFCADGVTLQALVAELAQEYMGKSIGEAEEEEELLQYADVAAWQDELLTEEGASEQSAFWQHINVASLETLRLPNQQPTEKSELTPDVYPLPCDSACEQSLTNVAAQLSVAKESVLLAAWQLFLARLTNQEDLVTGVAYSGRSYEELQGALGLYTRVIPFPTFIDPLTSFAQLIRQVDLTAKEIEQRQLYFTWNRMPSGIPTSVATTFEYLPAANRIETPDLCFHLTNITSYTEPFVLKLAVADHQESLHMQLHFDSKCFSRQTIASFAVLFTTLLQQALSQYDAPVQELRLLSKDQEIQTLQQFRGEHVDFPALTLVDLFEQQVERTPEAPAVTSDGRTLSYRQVNTWANRVARALQERGVHANVLVGLCTQRSVEMLVGLLAILKAGGAYMALDPQLPVSRLQYQLNDAQAFLVVSQSSVQDVFANIPVNVILLEAFQEAQAASLEENLAVDIKQEDLAYVIYTSGSTGVPKGVLIQHNNVSNYIQALSQRLAWEPGWQFATVSTLAADLGNTVIFGSLVTGGCLHILDYETVTSAQRWGEYVRSHPIDVLKIVPSHMSALLAASDQEEIGTLLPRRQLIMGGEALSASLLAQLVQSDAPCEIINHYGPTETTVGVLVNQLGRVQEEWKQPREATIPIGKPLSNIEVAIVNAGGQLMPIGVAGELYIAGAGVARRYLNQPEQTAARFIEMSWGEQGKKRYYRTGDLAKYRDDGTIEFVGRVDTQVKIRGYRVELGEIERVLDEHEDVRESVVLLREDKPGEQRLVAYVVPKTQAKVESATLLKFVQQRLPGYMVPGTVVMMAMLPLTPNGKIDRCRLPEPEEIIPIVSQQYEAPHNQIEETLASIWEDVLNIPRVSVLANFFTLGGHSLLATQVISRIRTAFGIELPILKLFEEPTVVGVAQRISELLQQDGAVMEVREQHRDIVPVSRDQALPLSFAQQRLWFLDQLQPGSLAYNKHLALRLSGELDFNALEASLSEIVRRHESLRTTFSMEGEQPVQVIHEARPLSLSKITLLEESASAREEMVQRFIKHCVEQPFDLTSGPLLRVHLFQLEETVHILVLTMHHIISDAWSNAIFMRELTQLYTAFVNGESATLPELGIQYADFAAWQQQWIQGPVLEEHLAYWREQLRDVATLDLPVDRSRPAVSSGHALHVPFTFSPLLQDRLNALSQESGTTLFMTLLAAFQVLLARYSGQADIAVGSPIANRSHTEIEELIGFFVNMLVLRSNLAENPTFAQVLHQVRETTLQAFAHQDLPFERIVEELQPDRDLSINPLYQVSFSLQNTPLATLDLPGLTLYPIVSLDATTKVDLELHMWESPEGLQGTLIYNTDLFALPMIEQLIAHFQVLLDGICHDPNRSIGSLPLLTEITRETLSAWSEAKTEYPVTTLVSEYVEQQAARHPDALAVWCDGRELTYAQLNSRANQLAHFLRAQGVGPEIVVGICMQRTCELYIAMLAILKAGGAYLPIDSAYPAERIAYMLQDAHVALLLTQSSLVDNLAGLVAQTIALDTNWSMLEDFSSENLPQLASTANLAYVIYTSGSTGRPKGVQITQANLLNLIQWHQQTYHVEAQDRATQLAGVAFDACVWEVWPYLTAGASLHVPDEQTRLSPELLVQWFNERQITISFLPTPMAEQVLAQTSDCEIHSLRALLTGGDALKRWPQPGTPFHLFNHYGPTEATVLATAGEVLPLSESEERIPPIGRVVEHSSVYILDQHMQQVPIGVIGELYIGGAGVGRGYQGRADLTAERFVANPFGKQGGERLYRSGDLARFLPDGNLEFCGRADNQVKVRGFRIEIGEINTVLSQHPSVRECVVVVHPDSSGQNQIVAYVVAMDGQLDVSAVRNFVQQKLPEYMVPAIFMLIDELPLTPNGKVDYRKLPAPESVSTAEEYVAARNPIEEVLVEIWSQVLGIERLSVHDNFFELGGHSLLATKLRARIQAVLHKDIPLRSLFEHPSVAEQAAWIIEEGRQQKLPAIVSVGRDQDLPLSFAQQRLWFLDQLEPESVAYNSPIILRIQGVLNTGALTNSIEKIVQRHESLRTRFALVHGQAVQIIDPVGQIPINVIDIRGKVRAEQEEIIAEQVQQEVQRPFQLTTGPLLRVKVIQLSEVEHIFLMVVHHIVWDGWSFNTFLQELFALYTAQIEERVATLPDLPVQYADYAVWQREWLQGEVLDQQFAYWQRQLAGVVPLELPTDHIRPAIFSGKGQRQEIVLPRALSERIQELSQREGVTQFMLLLTAFQLLLSIYSRQQDICVGTPVANRGQEEIEHVIGFFVNTLVMRADLSNDPIFLELLQQVRSTVLDAYAHQDIPFEKLVEALQPERDRSRTPLFQVMFVYQNALDVKAQPAGLQISEVESEKYTSKFDLTLIVAETAQGLSCTVEYSTDLFEYGTMQRFLSHWHCLLESLVKNPAQKVSMVSLLSDAEQQLLLSTWNATQVAIQKDSCLHQLFEQQVERDPDAIALMYRERTMTYWELNERSNQLAHYLRARYGVGPDRLVGISIERSPETIVAVLGVLKAGGGYVPLDPSYPSDRLTFMMKDADLAVLLTCQDQRRDDLLEGVGVVCLDTDWYEISHYSDLDPENLSNIQNIAYVIYTSGSTGTPKGVMVAHENVLNLVHSMQQKHPLTSQSRVLQYMTFNFDVSVVDIFTALLAGARLCLVPADTMVPDEALHKLLQDYQVTFGRIPPSILAALSSEDLPHLKTILTGGDRSVSEVVSRWAQGRQYFNEYGPTETTVLCTYAECFVGQQEIHIGRPIMNTRAYILNDAFQPVPIGVPGELYIGGDGVSRGYLKRPELTAERFIPEPWSTQPGARLYRTGDLVQYLPTGEIKILGRTDDQIKIRGFRIELGEIEDAINRHPLVQESVVLGRERARGDKQLVAYVEVGTANVTGQELRELLQEKLPAYMIPAHFVFLPTLPTTLNVGKVDRQALLAMDIPEEEAQTVVAARSLTEELVLACWREVLGREHISIHDDFFVCGGHSILASQLIARLRATFKVDLPLRMLFDAPTIAEQAELIEQACRSNAALLPPEIVRFGLTQQIPLSFEQQRLWFLHQLEPESIAYNLPFVVRLRGILDVAVLERSLAEVIRRHEILRTTFSSGNGMSGPWQQVVEAGSIHIPIITLQEQVYRVREAQAQRHIQNIIEHPFDLSQDRLFRCQLICMSEHDHILVLNMHHIISDGWSMGVMIRELTTLYTAYRQGEPSPLAEPTLQYADYALWQRNWLQGGVLQEQLAYWKHALAEIEPLNLPTDYPRSAVTSKRGATQTFLVPTAILAGLKRLSQQESATLFMTLLSVFQILLSHYSQRDDIVVGTVSAHRTQRSLESLIGFFVNMLPLRTKISSAWTFLEILRNVRETTLDAYAHQDVPFDQIVDAVQPTRDLSTSPIFQVLFMLQNVPFSEQELAELDLRSIEVETNSAKFDLSLILSEVPQGLSCSLEYSTDLFHAETIQRLADHFQQLLVEVLADPEQPIGRYPMLTEQERMLLTNWSKTSDPITVSPVLHELIAQQALRTPHQQALLASDGVLSYAQLDQQANQLAHYLQQQGVGPESRVGLCLERGSQLLVGMLAILKAGGAYVPLDPQYPIDRLQYIQQDARIKFLVTQETLQQYVAEPGIPVIAIDRDAHLWQDKPVTAPVCSLDSENLAYVIYTSGSTGRPKGVMLTHRSVVSLIFWSQRTFSPEELKGVLFSTSICFDLSVYEIFVTLSCGGTIILAENALALVDHPYREQVTLLNTVPSAMAELLRQQAVPEQVHTVNTCGEPLPYTVVEQLRKLPQIERVYNFYGPTEDTVYSTVAQVIDCEGSVPIGRPIAGSQVYILDERLQQVPVGAIGELYLGGDGLARGYQGRGDLTAERFFPNPFAGLPGGRMYRTGDLVRYRYDGELEYLGRIDHQVKVRGFRIELGEIEYVLRQHPVVKDVVVVAREEAGGSKRLVAYLACTAPDAGDELELRNYVQERLPAYMVPANFMFLDALPQTPNGKVDRKALPAPEQHQSNPNGVFAAPQTREEEIIARIWSEVLELEQIGIYDNFFAVGGDSILSLQIVARLREHGMYITPRHIFEHQTIAELALVLAQDGGVAKIEVEQGPDYEDGASIPTQYQFFETPEKIDSLLGNARGVDAVYPLSPLQKGFLFHSLYEPDRGEHIIQTCFTIEGPLNETAFCQAWQKVSEQHSILRTSFLHEGLQEPVQVVMASAPVPIVRADLRERTAEEQQAYLETYLREDRIQGFVVTQAPLMRLCMCRLAPEKYQVIWTYHHLLLDGWSLPLLLKDLFTCYEAFSRQQEPVLGQVRPYHDYLVWLQQQSMEEAEAFWRERLQGFMAPTKLKVESGVDNVSEVEPGYKKCILQLSEELTQRLQQLVRQRQLTLNTLIQGAWAVLLSRYSGEQDVVFGATVAGRPAEVPGIERMVGLFINTLPIRVKFSASQPVLNVLHRVQQDQLDVSRYEYSPLAQVQSWSNIPAGTALFESLLVFENYPVKSVLKEQSEQQQLDVQFNQTIEQTNYPLMLEVLPNTQLLFQLSYNRSHFSQATVERMLNHLQTILEYILVHPEHTVAEIPLLTQEERQQWLVEQNQTQVAYPLDESVAVQIAYHAQHHPTMTALVCGQTRMSYGQLQERATQLAHRLRKLGVGPDVLVGLYMPRSIEMVVGMLAIFQAGGAYLPLDLATPRERLEMVLNEAQPQVVLTHTHLRDQLPMSEASILTLHPSWQGLAQESTEPLLDEMDNQRLAYVIYTSGSTGRPKGVMVTHKGMLNHLYIKIDELSLTEYDRVAQTASHCFDISVWQIFASLLCGGQVHILPDEIAHDPENLAAVVEREGLTVLEVVPSFLRAIVEMHSSEKLVRQLRALRWLVVTGEALPADLCHRWCQMSPVSLVNAYGPTECSDDITHLMIEKAPERIAGVMPIGKALANTTLYILDKWLQPVPEGIAAELYIGGTGVGRGYLGDPVRTATAFVPHPFSQEPGERLYRTGDLARFLSDGTVEFVGRIDYQVKVRGFRIELGEIEAALQQLSMVQESVVLVREDVPGNQRIVAYIVCSTDEKPDTEDLKRALREKLPEYMVPSVFITLPTMPLTPNGKIDRRALPTPEEQDEARGAQADSARRPMEELLTMYWCDVLGLNHVGVHDNFFELGGQSLLAMRLISRIRAELQVEITLKHLFEAQTIAGLAEKIDQLMRAAQHVATPPLVPRADDEKLQLSFAQQRLWFIDQLEPGNAAYNIPLALQLDGKLNRDALAYSLQEIVRRHETLRTTFVVEDELPVQVIHPSDIFQMNSIDLEEMPFESHEEHIRQLARREAELPFDLTVGPLLRATLIRCNDQKHVLLLTMHHIASDGWSMGVLLRDLSTIYRAYVNGKQPSLPMLPVQYADVARWERMWMQGDLLQSHLDYWRHQLSGYEVLQMPTDRPRSATPTSRGAAYQFELSRAVADALGVLNQQEGVTMFMTLLTVFQIILQRYCDQNDIVIGTDVAGRNRVEVENLIGFFVNQLVLRSDLSGEPTFRELLRHNRNMCMDAYVHQDIPFEKLVEELKPKRGQNMAPFFQVKFLLQNLPIGASQELPDITVRALAPEVTSTKLDIVLQITPSEDGLHGLFTYSTELFDESTMKRMAENFKVLVLSILAHPDAPISKLEMCTQEEREQQQREQQQREQAAIKKFKGIKPKAISVKRN